MWTFCIAGDLEHNPKGLTRMASGMYSLTGDISTYMPYWRNYFLSFIKYIAYFDKLNNVAFSCILFILLSCTFLCPIFKKMSMQCCQERKHDNAYRYLQEILFHCEWFIKQFYNNQMKKNNIDFVKVNYVTHTYFDKHKYAFSFLKYINSLKVHIHLTVMKASKIFTVHSILIFIMWLSSIIFF